jgi:predicted nucleotidyltransferase component of viral defense system
VTAPTRTTTAGRAYLDLRRRARHDRRPVDELLQLYVLESFLARMSGTRFAERFVLKGGVLLAAFGERRPTRDIDLQAQSVANDLGTVRATITDIAVTSLDDGVIFDTHSATAEVFREEDQYQAVRVRMTASLATARPILHVDVSVGDPITPKPQIVQLPRVLGGTIAVLGYPLAMVYAEKIVTAITRGTANTRWRDFADMYALARRHTVDGTELRTSIREVARHRGTRLAALSNTLEGYDAIGQQRWEAWRRKQRLDGRLPGQFGDVVATVVAFADPAITGMADGRSWDSATCEWS